MRGASTPEGTRERHDDTTTRCMRHHRTMQASESANTGMQLNPGTEDANDDAMPAVADPANAI